MHPLVPLLIPEVNATHLALVRKQQKARGYTGAIVTIMNARGGRRMQQSLVATRQDLQANTDKTEQSVIQLQNNNRAVAKTGELLNGHTEQLQEVVEKLSAESEALALKVTQAEALHQRLEDLHVVLKTAERQASFDQDIAELKALLMAMQPPPKRKG